MFWSTIDLIAATLVGIGPACAPALSRAAVAARNAVRSELNNLMITSVLCGSAWRGPVNSLGRRCRGGFDLDQTASRVRCTAEPGPMLSGRRARWSRLCSGMKNAAACPDAVLNLSAPRARDTQNPLAIQCQRGDAGETAEPLLILLRRLATESAREACSATN